MKNKGFTLIELMIVIAIIAIIAAIAIPNLIEARKSANEAAAIAGLRTILTAEAVFRDRDLNGDGRPTYTDLASLVATTLIDGEFADGAKQGFGYGAGTTDEGYGFEAGAGPQSANTGTRGFFIDETGVMRFVADGVNNSPDDSSPVLGG